MKICLAFLLTIFVLSSLAQSPVDVQHYMYYLSLNDANDQITGRAEVTVRFVQPVAEFSLDLVGQGSDGKGMNVSKVTNNAVTGFHQVQDRLTITLSGATTGLQTFTIDYRGIPADGLIISKNKYGDRSFFADNWPNRAHYWIPCVDRPDDKASFEFIVTAPSVYKVISNGALVEQKPLENGRLLTHWKEDVSLPTKVM